MNQTSNSQPRSRSLSHILRKRNSRYGVGILVKQTSLDAVTEHTTYHAEQTLEPKTGESTRAKRALRENNCSFVTFVSFVVSSRILGAETLY